MNLGGLRELWTAPVPDGPDLRVVGERRGHSATTYLVALVLSLLFLVLFGLAVFQTVLIGAQGRLDDLDAQIRTEQDRQHDLRLRLAELESPERIVDAATERLGMVPPDEVLWLTPAEDTPTSSGAVPDGPTSEPTAGDGSEVASASDPAPDGSASGDAGGDR